MGNVSDEPRSSLQISQEETAQTEDSLCIRDTFHMKDIFADETWTAKNSSFNNSVEQLVRYHSNETFS